MTLSIITPVLNEASGIAEFLSHLRARASTAEVIVVDGESDDGTFELASSLADELSLRMMQSKRGRATQMNAGARAASGDVLWFVHADSRVPFDCERAIAQTMAKPGVAVGCFRLRFPRPNYIYRISDSWGNLAVDLFGIAFGDHGIFCRREGFLATGGFPEVPVMEDAEFCRRMKRTGRMVQLPLEIQTSPRRYALHGPFRTTFFYLLIILLYFCGASLPWLSRLHQRLSSRRPAKEKALKQFASTRHLAPIDRDG
jgi:rSAM/selenodomain-associated transferase 2